MLFALIDCNNFYASCERVFNPALNNRPVVILSNNDGCIIARSQEAKALGIAMGEPLFKCADIIKKHNVVVHSSNFALYGDMSARVMNAIHHFTPYVEIYSIDEAFILIPEHIDDPSAYAHILQAHIKQWTGIPVSIGIGTTKTLAKVANKIAKKNSEHNGMYNIAQHHDIDALLQTIPVADIWGIGRRYTKFLQSYNITTAYQLKNCADDWIKKNMTIVGLQTVWELRGTPCLSLQEHQSPNKSIAHTRSFGTAVTTLQELQEAVADYVAQAAVHLRDQQSVASAMQVFIHTSLFNKDFAYYKSTVISFAQPTNYTPELISYAHKALETLFKPGYKYKKAGIILMGFVSSDHEQISLFDAPAELPSKKQIMMQSLDRINNKWGKRSVLFAAQGINHAWKSNKHKRTPAYTTSWHDLPVVKTK